MEFVIERLTHIFHLPLTENVALFSFILAVILIMPILTQKLRLPQVIGLILCGVIVGPHALALVDNTGAISLFSTIGLLYIMFTAGLELDLNQFKLNKNKSFVFGFLTWFIPLAVIFPICFFAYDLSFLQSFLIGSMFGTHTLIAYPTVSRMGVASDACVAVSVGGTILVDAGVLILLAIILGLASGNLTASFWAQLSISLIAFTLVMFLVVPKIGKWFFAHWHREKHLRYIFIIFMVFLSALMAEMAGLEGIVGAFLAGLVLNRLIPKNSSLMHNIEFVGNAIFIPIFLVTVGMLVDLGVIAQGPETIILAVVLSVAAIGGKFGAAWISQKLFRYTAAQRNVMFGLSTARVAATLAIVLVAYKAGLINVIFLNAAILLILITCITASFITESAAQKLAVEHAKNQQNDQLHQNGACEHVLLPIANPANTLDLLDFSDILRSPQSNIPTTLLAVVPDNEQADRRIRDIRGAIQKAVKSSDSVTKHTISTVLDTSVSDGISRAVREQLASTLLLGWPQSGLTDKLIGEKWKAVIHDIDLLVIWADLPMPMANPKRLAVFTLKNAERERGFDDWFDKIIQIAEHFSLEIVHLGTPATSEAMRTRLAEAHKTIPVESYDFDPFRPNEHEGILKPDDWIVFVSARRDTLCYVPACEHAPSVLSTRFKGQNKLLIFPSDPFACSCSENPEIL